MGDRRLDIELFLRLLGETRDIPRLGVGVVGNMKRDHLVDDFLAHVGDMILDALVRHDFAAAFEDHLALIVHHIVELQHVLAHVEVARLDLLLRLLQRLVDPGMDDRLALLQSELDQHRIHALGAEDAHQIVLQRQVEFRAPRIALATRASAQLIVDASALVALRADDIEAAGGDGLLLEPRDLGPDLRFLGFQRVAFEPDAFLRNAHLHIAAKLNVGAAARHVGRDGDRAGHAGFRDDIGLELVEAGIQHREQF